MKQIFPPPNPAETLLSHFDRLAGGTAEFINVADAGAEPALFVAIYRGFPVEDALTGFTFGLSHFHPAGGGHKELVISMCDADNSWALACGHVAWQLREHCPFECGDTVNFGERIANSTRMSAFLVTHPRHIAPRDAVVDLGVRQVELVELIPIYEDEHRWLNAGGSAEAFLQSCSRSLCLDPQRKSTASN